MTLFGSLSTAGYANKDCEDFLQQALRANRSAFLVDTRRVPSCSWSSLWTMQGLQERYADRYIWRGDWLGNIHYNRPSLPIQLKDEAHGLPWIIERLNQGDTLILLCGCSDKARCHRQVIYNKVRALVPDQLPEYPPGTHVLTPYGPGVIDPDIPLEVHQARNRYAVIHDTWTPHRYLYPSELQSLEFVQPSLIA